MKTSNTKSTILTVAESLIQSKGFNGFSYKDIAEAVGIRKASIHHHFPTKEDLGVAVLDWHLEKLKIQLMAIAQKKTSIATQLNAMFDLILDTTYNDNKKMCLGGMFASDILTLSQGIKHRLKVFFIEIAGWIEERLVEYGYDKKDAELKAKQLTSQIEGSLLLGRLYGEEDFFTGVRSFIKDLTK